ncbi:hypothetical protein OG767_13690 [Micromonospora sp. NBC_01392]|uniref:hypothetical protein n=1 Tax=Micromonospora sp. NBC_01392 TaxID=2903588 RepID=UPI00324B7CD4
MSENVVRDALILAYFVAMASIEFEPIRQAAEPPSTGDVEPVADGQTDSDRDTRAFDDDMTFRAGFDAVALSWVALLIPHVRIVEQRLHPVEHVRSMRIGRQHLVSPF